MYLQYSKGRLICQRQKQDICRFYDKIFFPSEKPERNAAVTRNAAICPVGKQPPKMCRKGRGKRLGTHDGRHLDLPSVRSLRPCAGHFPERKRKRRAMCFAPSEKRLCTSSEGRAALSWFVVSRQAAAESGRRIGILSVPPLHGNLGGKSSDRATPFGILTEPYHPPVGRSPPSGERILILSVLRPGP